MYFKGQNFLVAGISGSGRSAARFLLARGAKVFVYDDFINADVRSSIDELVALGAKEVTAAEYEECVEKCDVLVLSPGIPIDNPLPVAFRRAGKLITGEEELACHYLRATSVAVTGTNGKTTTVSMLAQMLSDCGVRAFPCGNFGEPTLSLRPHVAVVTNITEDHLNRHYNMENYVYLKSKLVRGLRESEYAVLNYDDERVRGFSSLTRAKVVYFSARRQVEGAYVQDGCVYFMGQRLFACSDMAIGGGHNVYNALACAAVGGILGLDGDVVARSLCAFKGVRHRIEVVGEIDGVTYIDDSKATNVDAALKAVQSMSSATVILLGGKDKGYDFKRLFEGLNESSVVHAVLYGEARYKLLDAALQIGFSSQSATTIRRQAQTARATSTSTKIF